MKIVAVACRIEIPEDLGAVKKGDFLTLTLPAPARHHHVLHSLAALGLPCSVSVENQGFLLEDGTYIDREPAGVIAVESGQIEKLNWPPQLFSEDLW